MNSFGHGCIAGVEQTDMIIIWKRWGILVIPLWAFGMAVGMETVRSGILPAQFDDLTTKLVMGNVVAGVMIWCVGRWMNSKVEANRLVWQDSLEMDDAGREQEERNHLRIELQDHPERLEKHSFFFIPIEYWGFIAVGCAALVSLRIANQ
jgi:hypothetical protein